MPVSQCRVSDDEKAAIIVVVVTVATLGYLLNATTEAVSWPLWVDY